MKWICYSLIILSLTFLVNCDDDTVYVSMVKIDAGEYWYLKRDENVSGNGLVSGFSLKSSWDGRVIYSFRSAPSEIRLKLHNNDGIEDLVYIIKESQTGVNGKNLVTLTYVALGMSDGTYGQPHLISNTATTSE